MGRKAVKILNFLTRIRRPACAPDRILLLIPTCLQRTECPRNVNADVENCERCGQCKLDAVLDISDRYGTRRAVATGGRLALSLAQDDDIDGVVAIACEKELQEGLWGVFPKPALGVINLRPNGPCRDTDVDLEAVEEAIRALSE